MAQRIPIEIADVSVRVEELLHGFVARCGAGTAPRQQPHRVGGERKYGAQRSGHNFGVRVAREKPCFDVLGCRHAFFFDGPQERDEVDLARSPR